MRMCIKSRGKLFLRVLRASPGIVFFCSPLIVVVALVSTAVPFATGSFVDAITYKQPSHGPFLVLVVLLLLKTLLGPILQRFICSHSRGIETDLQIRVLDATMNLQPSQLIDITDGEVVAKLSRDTYAIGAFFRGLYPRIIQAVVMLFAAGCALFARSTVLAISFMAFFPLLTFLFVPFARRFSTSSHRIRRQSEVSFSALFDFLTMLPLLRMLDAERRFDDVPKTALGKLKDGNDDTDGLSIRFGFLLGILVIIGEITVLGFAGVLAARDIIPVGDVVLYQMLFIAATQAVQGVISLLPEFAALRESMDSLCEVLGRTPMDCGHEYVGDISSLEFKHVTFAYPRAPGRSVVRDFSAKFLSGTAIGLSGENGTGKSTLLKLAVNALEPLEGEIFVNGHSLIELDLAAFRRRIGIVFQDNLLISGTIRDNITLRDPVFTHEDIDNALTLSGFDTVVRQIPNGLDAHVDNRVCNLSGGERQRLAIARAIIRNPLILILDEATNHLDVEARKRLADLVERMRPGRLILIADHDVELDKLCDVKISCQSCSGRVFVAFEKNTKRR